MSLLVAVLGTPASEQAMAAFECTWAAIGTGAVAAFIPRLSFRRASSTQRPSILCLEAWHSYSRLLR